MEILRKNKKRNARDQNIRQSKECLQRSPQKTRHKYGISEDMSIETYKTEKQREKKTEKYGIEYPRTEGQL